MEKVEADIDELNARRNTSLVKYGSRSLEFERKPIDIADAKVVIDVLMGFTLAIAWFWGDFLNGCEKWFGPEYSQLIPETDKAPKTLVNWKWVCGCIPPVRRIFDVPFSHYAEVAALPPAEQDEWLKRCEEEGLSVCQLRKLLRPDGNEDPLPVMVTCPACGASFDKNALSS